ncbi:hypothetical protein M422DRAFT_258931 [Sphaerobolus stellatus SS14]|uniref:Uncharacterized protein n=1 Tax=Sphaerobolus stellatus (strain SS14) TaxID=990650 RepID=A0A0C9VKL1_SPHS4|nr:hypothetical protein M422DRAFT_258931 [Sphaerobolus stellatus SS14]
MRLGEVGNLSLVTNCNDKLIGKRIHRMTRKFVPPWIGRRHDGVLTNIVRLPTLPYPTLPYPPHFIPIPNSITATHIFDDNLHANERPSDWRRISSTIISKLSVMRRRATPIDLAAPRGENR